MQKNHMNPKSAKKSLRNGIKTQTSTTYSKIKKPALIAGLTIVLMCYIFSTIAQATSQQNITLRRISNFQMYGYSSDNLSTPAWRSMSYTITSSNSLETADIIYGQISQRIQFNIDVSAHIEHFKLEFDVYGKYLNISTSVSSTGYPAVRIPQSSSTWYYGTVELTDQEIINGETYYTYHVKVEQDGLNINSTTFGIHTYFNVLSTKFIIKNFSFVLNDEIVMYLSEYEQKLDDLNNVISGYKNKIDEFNSRYIENKNSVLSTIVMPNAGYTAVPSILSATVFAPFMAIIGYAILSFILYGRK